MSLQFRRTAGGKTVDNPSTVTPAFDHSVLAKVGEMLGNPRLADLQNFLKMAHAERPPSQEIDDPEASRVAKALVDLNQFHVGIYSCMRIFVNANLMFFDEMNCRLKKISSGAGGLNFPDAKRRGDIAMASAISNERKPPLKRGSRLQSASMTPFKPDLWSPAPCSYPPPEDTLSPAGHHSIFLWEFQPTAFSIKKSLGFR